MSLNKKLLAPLMVLCLCTTTHSKSAGCGKLLPSGLVSGGASRNMTMYSRDGGGERRFLVYLPERFGSGNDGAAQLVMAFHGQMQTTAGLEGMTGLSDPWFNRDAIVVYPEGLDYKAPGHQWLGDPGAPPSSVVDDRVFVSDLLDYITSTFCVDENRIYAAGFSNGGGLVNLLACSPLVNRRIAAFATVAGAFYTNASLTEPLFGTGCQPDLTTRKRIPIMSFHGSADDVIAYNGNNSPAPNTIPIPEWLGAWAARENCVIRGPRTGVVDPYISLFGWYCPGDVETGGGLKDVVVSYRIYGFGHGWPRTVPLEGSGVGATDVNATRDMMIFFDEWRLDMS